MDDKVAYRRLTGRVYYEPMGGNTGQIKIITFAELSAEETEGLSVVIMDPAHLIPFINGTLNPAHHILFLKPDSQPTIIKKSVDARLALYEEVFRLVHHHNGESGLVILVDGHGVARVVARDLPDQIYPENSPIFIYVTKPNQPNMLIWQSIVTLGEIVRGGVELKDLPVGYPVADYSVWCISAGPLTPIWWSSQ